MRRDSLAVLFLAMASACTGVNVTTTNLGVTTRGSTWTFAGLVDTSAGNEPPGACNGTPTPPAPDVAGWWAGIDPQTRNTVVVTGFQLWSNTLPGCANARQDMYRGHFSYDLTALTALSTANSPIATRINAATLRLTIQGGLTRTATPSAKLACFANTGGVGAVNLMQPGTPILTGMNYVVHTTDFPPTVSRVDQIAGLPVPGTLGRSTTSVGGGGITVVDLDVKDFLLGALNRGDAAIAFSLTGIAETISNPTGDEMLECRTFTTPGPLTVKSL
jgi:hypothetical protein